MARWSWLILTLFVVLTVSAQDLSTSPSAVKEVFPADQAKATSSEPEKKSSATTATTKGTTTQTNAPDTTSLEPTTTTTTTTTTPTTTTPPTTTVTIPTTTPAVVPVPSNETWPKNVGHWNITGSNNVSCLLLDAAFEINLKYTQNTTTNVTHVLVPSTAKLSGDCKTDNVVVASLTWFPPTNLTVQNNLMLTFGKQNTTDGKEKYELKEILLSVLNYQNDSIVSKSKTNLTLFETPLERSYKCSKDTSIQIATDVELVVTSLQFQAFSASNSSGFSTVLECSSDDVSAVVPFAVGASLALLVVIVLIAYLIGRRRSRARGYQSV